MYKTLSNFYFHKTSVIYLKFGSKSRNILLIFSRFISKISLHFAHNWSNIIIKKSYKIIQNLHKLFQISTNFTKFLKNLSELYFLKVFFRFSQKFYQNIIFYLEFSENLRKTYTTFSKFSLNSWNILLTFSQIFFKIFSS